ncbi:MAG: recombinase family protein, partial [Anaerolineae bacterium]
RGMVQWGKPSYSAIYQMLKHPAYAGAYSYGKHHNVRLPGAGRKVVTRKLPMDEWPVLIQEAFPGYITWEQYVQNQKQLKQNAQGVFQSQGAPRRGAALLQGLVLCAHCGRRMQVVYNRSPAYVCRQARHQYDAPNCQYFTAPYVDAAVTAVFLQAIEPARLEAALAAVDDIEAESRQLAAQWQSRLERARYQANLARRRYQQVDPDNRLVAAELERRWEEKLQTVAQLEQEWSEGQSQAISPLSASDKTLIRHLAADLPALWHADTTSNQERKRLLRGLIQDVTLDSVTEPDKSLIHIRWHTGANTLVKAHRPKPGRRTNHALLARIRELAQHHPDDQIAGILNAEGVRTYTGLPWTRERVFGVRRKNGIPTACPYRPDDPGPRGDGLIPVKEAVQRLGVAPSVIGDWFRRGLLAGHQRRPGSPLWVRVSAADLQRLDGSATLSPEMIPLPEAPKRLEMTQEQFLQALRSGQWLAYRLRIENRWRWYVWPPSQQSSRLSEAH